MTPPVLFVIFARPDITARTMAAIRKAQPSKLYIAADGPRHSRASDARSCEECRDIATTVDWPCEVHTLFQSVNLGCSVAVTTAIDWFFLHEPAGIILEDDCTPTGAFFSWCDFALQRFQFEPEVFSVAGRPLSDAADDATVIQVCKYAHIWGWATWRDRWERFRAESPRLSLRQLRTHFDHDDERRYWDQRFHFAFSAWDFRLQMYALGNGLSTILPPRRLIANQGCIGGPEDFPAEPASDLEWPRLPIVRDREYDRRVFTDFYLSNAMNCRLSKRGRLCSYLRTMAALTDSPAVLAAFDKTWCALASCIRLLGSPFRHRRD